MSADSFFCKGTTFWEKVAKTHNESLSSTTQKLTLGVSGMDLQGRYTHMGTTWALCVQIGCTGRLLFPVVILRNGKSNQPIWKPVRNRLRLLLYQCCTNPR